MSFNLCRKSDRGTITDLEARGGGIDAMTIKNGGESILKQPSHKHNNFAIDTSVRTIMEGKRNVYTCTVPEEGDLLAGATLVLRPIHSKTMVRFEEDKNGNRVQSGDATDLIDSIEVRLNGQCIQHINGDEMSIPFTGINSSYTKLQEEAYDGMIGAENAPFLIPINAFFSTDGNAFPLIDNEYPLEIKVNFKNNLHIAQSLDQNAGILTVEDLEVVLMTSQVYLEESERQTLLKSERNMVITQRHHQRVQPSKTEPVVRFRLESNLPLKSIYLSESGTDDDGKIAERLQSHSMIRYIVNGNVRFEHYAKFLEFYGRLQGHHPNGDEPTYHFGIPSTDGVRGRTNLSLLDNPMVEIHDLLVTNDLADDYELYLTTVNYNVLVWKNGRAYVVLHKSR